MVCSAWFVKTPQRKQESVHSYGLSWHPLASGKVNCRGRLLPPGLAFAPGSQALDHRLMTVSQGTARYSRSVRPWYIHLAPAPSQSLGPMVRQHQLPDIDAGAPLLAPVREDCEGVAPALATELCSSPPRRGPPGCAQAMTLISFRPPPSGESFPQALLILGPVVAFARHQLRARRTLSLPMRGKACCPPSPVMD